MMAGFSMMGAAVYIFCCQDASCSVADGMVLGLLGLIFALVVWKHRSNIVRLCNGTEPKAFSKK